MLAIEKSQRQGSVAVSDDSGATHVEPLRAAKRHDDDLLPAIDRLMKRLGLGPRDLEAVGVSVGPGGFTGLRIAVTTSKMFAEVLGVKVVPVPSALVAAEATSVDAGAVLVALASKGETFWATYLHREENREGWRVDAARPPRLVSSGDVPLTGISAVLADEHFPPAARQRCDEAGLALVQPVFAADACLRVAARLLADGLAVDPLQLSPIYPRQPEAVSLWERRSEPSSPAQERQ